jgi:hypothetical protein
MAHWVVPKGWKGLGHSAVIRPVQQGGGEPDSVPRVGFHT